MKNTATYNSTTRRSVDVKSVTIKIDCSNAAFDGNFAFEVASILEGIVRSVAAADDLWSFNLTDSNGNACGSVTVKTR